jgi:threonine/homoserine/homoserine lactone efflux protein
VFIGDAVLMFLAWAGVAALIQTTPVLFNIVRYLGAFYLLWLGGKMLWSVLTRQNKRPRRWNRACQRHHETLPGIEPDESESDSVLRVILRTVY